MSELARTPEPPYYAVIFTSLRTPGDNGCAEMADGVEITVSYWNSEESIQAWKVNGHQVAQRLGHEKWYESFATRVCKVEREYSIEK